MRKSARIADSHLFFILIYPCLYILLQYFITYLLLHFKLFFFLSNITNLETNIKNSVSFFISIVFIAPVLEEYVFRYPFLRLQKYLSSKNIKITLLFCIFSSILFSIAHTGGGLGFPIPQFFGGILLYYVEC